MRVLVTYGTKHGGTEGIAQVIGVGLARRGFEVTVEEAARVHDVNAFDAAVIGGALYANRWQRDARRFVQRNVAALRRMPVWFFSSGPVDDSAERTVIPPAPEVSMFMERIGALDHVTFGGCLAEDARGLTASAVAREHHGDFRNPERIRAWAEDLANALPQAKPGVALDHPAHSTRRLVAHGLAGWALCAGLMAALQTFTSPGVADTLHGIAVPCIFALVSLHYFRARGAHDPLFTAAVFTCLAALLDAVLLGGVLERSLSTFASLTGIWLPLVLVFLSAWTTGTIIAIGLVAKPVHLD